MKRIASSRTSRGTFPAAIVVAAVSLNACSTTPAPLPALSADEAAVETARAPFDRAPIDTVLRGFVERGQIAGVEAIVFQGDQEVYYGAFGHADREAQRDMTRDTLIQIYSMSKPITGVSLMQLYEKGLFQLDDPLAKYLPEFEHMKVYVGEDENGQPLLQDARRPITVRDITRHTAGFGDGGHEGLARWIQKEDPTSWENTLPEMSRRLAQLPLGYHPGERWLYSAAVDVQAYLVEKLSGVPYEQYATENVLRPLGMTETTFFVEPARQGRRAAEYQLSESGELTRTPDEEAFRFNSAQWPLDPGGFGWTSTIDDYLKFARMLLGEGQLGSAQILQPETVRLMATNHLDEAITERSWLPSKGQVGFGIDFAVRLRPAAVEGENYGEVGEFFWDGRDSTLFWVDPKNQLTAVLMVQLLPFDRIGLHRGFRRAVYDALPPG